MKDKSAFLYYHVVLWSGQPNTGSGVGKTQLFQKLLTNEYSDNYIPTKAVNWVSHSLEESRENGRSIGLLFLDTSTTEAFRPLSNRELKSADHILLVFDQATNSSFEKLELEINYIRGETSTAHITLVSTKSDLINPNHVSNEMTQHPPEHGESTVTPEAVSAFCIKHRIKDYYPVSAKNGSGISGLNQHIFDILQKRLHSIKLSDSIHEFIASITTLENRAVNPLCKQAIEQIIKKLKPLEDNRFTLSSDLILQAIAEIEQNELRILRQERYARLNTLCNAVGMLLACITVIPGLVLLAHDHWHKKNLKTKGKPFLFFAWSEAQQAELNINEFKNNSNLP